MTAPYCARCHDPVTLDENHVRLDAALVYTDHRNSVEDCPAS